jgi:hypothetical protein
MLKKLYLLVTFLAIISISSVIHARATDGKIKLLVLIIASDNHPIYIELQKIWRAYMHLDPEHVEVYFMKNNPNLSTQYQSINDEICASLKKMLFPD